MTETTPSPSAEQHRDATASAHQDAMNSLKFYVDLANSERQTIWTRHATMLVGNTILVNAARSDAAKDGGDALFLNNAGIALCIVSAVMICDGYHWLWKAMKDGKALPVGAPLNPFARIKNISAWWKDWLSFVLGLLSLSLVRCTRRAWACGRLLSRSFAASERGAPMARFASAAWIELGCFEQKNGAEKQDGRHGRH